MEKEETEEKKPLGRPPKPETAIAKSDQEEEWKARKYLDFEDYALVSAAYISLEGRVEKGYKSARRVSETEVVLNVPDKEGNIRRYVVTIPKTVSCMVRPYDLDE